MAGQEVVGRLNVRALVQSTEHRSLNVARKRSGARSLRQREPTIA
jgi:hypothetical protein